MENLRLPERMFAYGEEPNGERVNTYHKPKRIEIILDALDPEEVEFLRNSTFGKIISLAENLSFSAGFVDAIQLVFMEAVSQIKEVVPQPENVVVIESDSESDTEGGDSQAEVEEDELVVRPGTPPAAVRYYVNPSHVKSLDEDEKASLRAINNY
ncbi:unnamed protein product [Brassica rapa subsp. narinosa]